MREEDVAQAEPERFERLKTELVRAFNAPESSYLAVTAAEIIARNRH